MPKVQVRLESADGAVVASGGTVVQDENYRLVGYQTETADMTLRSSVEDGIALSHVMGCPSPPDDIPGWYMCGYGNPSGLRRVEPGEVWGYYWGVRFAALGSQTLQVSDASLVVNVESSPSLSVERPRFEVGRRTRVRGQTMPIVLTSLTFQGPYVSGGIQLTEKMVGVRHIQNIDMPIVDAYYFEYDYREQVVRVRLVSSDEEVEEGTVLDLDFPVTIFGQQGS